MAHPYQRAIFYLRAISCKSLWHKQVLFSGNDYDINKLLINEVIWVGWTNKSSKTNNVTLNKKL